MSIDPPTILADGSEVSVVVDEGAFLDMARHCFVPWIASSEGVKRDKTRCVWPCNKNRWVCESSLQTCKYVSSLSPTRRGSVHHKRIREKRSTTGSSRWVEQKGIRVCSQQDALVCRIAQDLLKKITWSTSGAAASACRDALDLAEYTRAVWCQVAIRAEELPDEWKEEHDCWL